MDVLILGQGGREHAIAWNLSKSSEINTVFVIPGNAGTFLDEGIQNVDIDLSNHAEIIKFVKDNKINLTIVGPEAPLVDGIVDLSFSSFANDPEKLLQVAFSLIIFSIVDLGRQV